MRPSTLFSLFACLAVVPFSLADIEITKPDADTTWSGGSTVSIEWKDSGEDPSLDDFSTFGINLCMGSNDNKLCTYVLSADAKFSASTTQTKVPLPASIVGIGNGDKVFFLQYRAVKSDGGYTLNYSKRFSIEGMTGTFSEAAVTEQKKGDTDSPDREDKSGNSAEATGAAAGAKVTYTRQTGKTKYAPMQSQPGTKITAKSAKRQYPTSDSKIFTTKGPKPNADTTITQKWDYSWTTKTNTAKPQPKPTDTKQKLLKAKE